MAAAIGQPWDVSGCRVTSVSVEREKQLFE